MFKFIKDFLKKLEDANSKSFGNGKLDCCDFNKLNNTAKNIYTKNK